MVAKEKVHPKRWLEEQPKAIVLGAATHKTGKHHICRINAKAETCLVLRRAWGRVSNRTYAQFNK